MKTLAHFKFILLTLSLITVLSCARKDTTTQKADLWLTTADQTSLLAKQAALPFTTAGTDTGAVITIDTAVHFQSIDVFGYALTGGSAWAIQSKLDATQRAALLKDLFLTDSSNIGISY